jgi:hypothetical protein
MDNKEVIVNKAEIPSGIEQLVDRYRAIFHVPENINYYSEKDYVMAEKKFIKFALMEGKINIS